MIHRYAAPQFQVILRRAPSTCFFAPDDMSLPELLGCAEFAIAWRGSGAVFKAGRKDGKKKIDGAIPCCPGVISTNSHQ